MRNTDETTTRRAEAGLPVAGTIAERTELTPPDQDVTTSALARRADVLTGALDAAGDAVDPALAQAARTDLQAVHARLRVGVDRTVVALAGGTGSGKSSMFNAIAGLDFADVGPLRPTTDDAAACVWGGRADELLDFLQVAPRRRITRESVLDAEQEKPLEGLVLLDLPDHDSVATEHWEQVDRLLPLVDIVLWVVDPQKYADHALHERYLRALTDRQDAMLVLVNQADTLPGDAVERVCEDVRRLLDADGLTEVEVLATSATERTGIEPVRERLAAAVAGSSAAARAAAAEVEAVAARLREAVGPGEPDVGDEDVHRAADELARACGTAAVAESVRSAVTDSRGGAMARPEPPAAAAVAAVRASWVRSATEQLPPRWVDAVGAALPSAQDLAQTTARSVLGVPLPAVREPRAARLTLLAGVLGAAALLYAVVMVAVGGTWLQVLAPTVVVLGLAGGCVLAARAARRDAGERRARRYSEEARQRTGRAVEELLAEPTREVLDRHRRLRTALERP